MTDAIVIESGVYEFIVGKGGGVKNRRIQHIMIYQSTCD